MHILLTDLLTCPRCGPEHGLILLADRIADRRVLEGRLGCSNCREQYPVRDGVVHFEEAGPAAAAAAPPEVAAVERLAALLGVTHGPAFLLLSGAAAGAAAALAALLEDVEVIALAPDASVRAARGVNPLVISGAALPIADMKVAGVALTGGAADTLLEEGARTVAPAGRLVLEPAPANVADRLDGSGLRMLAQQDATVVAGRH